MSSRVVHVEIQGQRYAIRSGLEPQYVGELAEFLNTQIVRARRELSTGDPLRLAVVAALNIVDELFRTKQDAVASDGHFRARAAEIERLLDSALDSPPRLEVVNGE